MVVEVKSEGIFVWSDLDVLSAQKPASAREWSLLREALLLTLPSRMDGVYLPLIMAVKTIIQDHIFVGKNVRSLHHVVCFMHCHPSYFITSWQTFRCDNFSFTSPTSDRLSRPQFEFRRCGGAEFIQQMPVRSVFDPQNVHSNHILVFWRYLMLS